jgi:hypothetical protein
MPVPFQTSHTLIWPLKGFGRAKSLLQKRLRPSFEGPTATRERGLAESYNVANWPGRGRQRLKMSVRCFVRKTSSVNELAPT